MNTPGFNAAASVYRSSLHYATASPSTVAGGLFPWFTQTEPALQPYGGFGGSGDWGLYGLGGLGGCHCWSGGPCVLHCPFFDVVCCNPFGKNCCKGACRDLTTDPQNCGKCGNACGSSEACCDGSCVSTQCPTNQKWDKATCQCVCSAPLCNGECCDPGYYCVNGQCVMDCPNCQNCPNCVFSNNKLACVFPDTCCGPDDTGTCHCIDSLHNKCCPSGRGGCPVDKECCDNGEYLSCCDNKTPGRNAWTCSSNDPDPHCHGQGCCTHNPDGTCWWDPSEGSSCYQ